MSHHYSSLSLQLIRDIYMCVCVERERERERGVNKDIILVRVGGGEGRLEEAEAFSMRKRIWIFRSLILMVECYLVFAREAMVEVQEKAEASIPVTTSSPPEGNTTFLDGTSWCVALAGLSQVDLQNALDWACGLGMADCGPIQSGGACFEPDTLLSHASYAFNYYYQQNGNSDIACNFGGTATLTKANPSYGKCVYASSESIRSSAPPTLKYKPSLIWWKVTSGFLLLLYF